MLREFGKTRQESSRHERRWFHSWECDLILWLNEDESLWGFQFCYDKPNLEHALTWVSDCGYSHMRVDTGSRFSQAPLLVPNGAFEPGYVLETFERQAALVPAAYRGFIAQRLLDLVSQRG
jgi:hypothetical protein